MWQEFVEKGLLVIDIDICSYLKVSGGILLDKRVSVHDDATQVSHFYLEV